MSIVFDYRAIEKRLREISGESWYPVEKVPEPIPNCQYCGSRYNIEEKRWESCNGTCCDG